MPVVPLQILIQLHSHVGKVQISFVHSQQARLPCPPRPPISNTDPRRQFRPGFLFRFRIYSLLIANQLKLLLNFYTNLALPLSLSSCCLFTTCKCIPVVTHLMVSIRTV